VKAYYEHRATEYDEWYYGAGQFDGRPRPGWNEEIAALGRALAALAPAHTLDVACGTGFLTRHLRGTVVGLDQSPAMLREFRRRLPAATALEADVVDGLPFEEGTFGRVFTGHFYGHLEPDPRRSFLAEARRVAPEVVVVDSALREDVERESVQERVLNDGTRWHVYKRYFTPEELLSELGGGRLLHAGRWFVAVASP
jgi:SAM-dependent methyltransferase